MTPTVVNLSRFCTLDLLSIIFGLPGHPIVLRFQVLEVCCGGVRSEKEDLARWGRGATAWYGIVVERCGGAGEPSATIVLLTLAPVFVGVVMFGVRNAVEMPVNSWYASIA